MPAVLVKKKRVTVGLVALAVLLCAGLLLANRNQPVAAGQNVVVTITADSLEDTYGYQFQMHYDEDKLEYSGSIKSKLEDIPTIFSKPFAGYELVGATMVGEKDGVTGNNKTVCELVFTAKEDSTLNNLALSINDINVVKYNPATMEEMEYTENIEGWQLKAAVQS